MRQIIPYKMQKTARSCGKSGHSDAYCMVEALKALDIFPKAVVEVGMGSNPGVMCGVMGGFPSIETYSIINRGTKPTIELEKAKMRVGDEVFGRVRYTNGDYLGSEASADAIIFNVVFETAASYKSVMMAKALTDLNPGGAVVMRTSVGYFRRSLAGTAANASYSTQTLDTISGAGFDIRYFREGPAGPEVASLEDITSKDSHYLGNDYLTIVCRMNKGADRANLLNSAVHLASSDSDHDRYELAGLPQVDMVSGLMERWVGEVSDIIRARRRKA